MRLIGKTLLLVIVMLVVYHVVWPHLSRKYFLLSGMQRDNYSRAQRYFYDTPDRASVILGSSLSLRLDEQALGPDALKLAFGGGNIWTGLEIIRKAGKHPAIVLIEINQIAWNRNDEMLGDLFSPGWSTLRRWSGIFREEGRPSNFVVGRLEVLVRKGCRLGDRILDFSPDPDPNQVNPELFDRLLSMHRRMLYDVLPEADLATRTARLAEQVNALTAGGSVCVFYEMPIHSSLVDLPAPVAVRDAMQKQFPRDKYYWLSFPSDHVYQTSDAYHLTQTEANKLSELIAQQLKQWKLRL